MSSHRTDFFGFEKMPLRRWVNDGIDAFLDRFRDPIRNMSDALEEGLVERVNDALVSGPDVMLVATVAILVFMAAGWRAGLVSLAGLAVLQWLGVWAAVLSPLTNALGPEPVVFGFLAIIAFATAGWRVGLLALLGLGLIQNLLLWELAMDTLTLVLAAGLICFIIGLPLGILMSRSDLMKAIIRPVLDFMQTMPAFVYLIPAVAIFSIGVMAALFATVTFALPPIVRLTSHGIEHVDKEVVEASDAFGANAWQTLVKVQLPLARPSIMVGVNQTLMLSLSMVVIAALIGAGGLGSIVLRSLSRVEAGLGFEGGISVVILAVLLDRVTQSLGKRNEPGEDSEGFLNGIAQSLRKFGRGFTTSGAVGAESEGGKK